MEQSLALPQRPLLCQKNPCYTTWTMNALATLPIASITIQEELSEIVAFINVIWAMFVVLRFIQAWIVTEWFAPNYAR